MAGTVDQLLTPASPATPTPRLERFPVCDSNDIHWEPLPDGWVRVDVTFTNPRAWETTESRSRIVASRLENPSASAIIADWTIPALDPHDSHRIHVFVPRVWAKALLPLTVRAGQPLPSLDWEEDSEFFDERSSREHYLLAPAGVRLPIDASEERGRLRGNWLGNIDVYVEATA